MVRVENKIVKKDGARGRNRTGTGFKSRGILSPLRLPIPPPGQKIEAITILKNLNNNSE